MLFLPFEYEHMVSEPRKNALVPNHGTCLNIEEDEMILKIQEIVSTRIVPEDFIDVVNYYNRLKIIFDNSLVSYEYRNTFGTDEFPTKCYETTVRVISWLAKQIDIKSSTPEILANLINKLVVRSFKGKQIIDKKIAQSFTELLCGKPIKKDIDWNETDWKLYVIIEHIIALHLLELKTDEIFDSMTRNFLFKGKKRVKKVLKDNIKRSKNLQVFKDFTANISQITTN